MAVEVISEKPSIEEAESSLKTAGVAGFLTAFGLYVLTPRIFSILEEAMSSARFASQIGMSQCFDRLRYVMIFPS